MHLVAWCQMKKNRLSTVTMITSAANTMGASLAVVAVVAHTVAEAGFPSKGMSPAYGKTVSDLEVGVVETPRGR